MKYLSRGLIILFGVMMLLFYFLNSTLLLFTSADLSLDITAKLYGFAITDRINYYDLFIPLFIIIIIMSFTKWYKINLYIGILVLLMTSILNFDYVLYGITNSISFDVNYYTAVIMSSYQIYDGSSIPNIEQVYINSGLIYSGFIIAILLCEQLILNKKER